METKNSRRDTLSQLAHLRDDFSDEIPNGLVTSASDDNRYMVRKSWWQGVIAGLDDALSENLISSDNKELVESFLLEQTYRLQKESVEDPRKPTTQEDLNQAKEVLDRVLGRNT